MGLHIPFQTYSQSMQHGVQIDMRSIDLKIWYFFFQKVDMHPFFFLGEAPSNSCVTVKFMLKGSLLNLEIFCIAKCFSVVAQSEVKLKLIFKFFAPNKQFLSFVIGSAKVLRKRLTITFISELMLSQFVVNIPCRFFLNNNFEQPSKSGIYFQNIKNLLLGLRQSFIFQTDDRVAFDGFDYLLVVMNIQN